MIKIGWVNTKEYIKEMECYHAFWEGQNNDNHHLNFSDISLFEKWCKENKIKKWYLGSYNWTYIVGNLARWNPNVEVPYQDHKALFKNDKNENILVIQPYYSKIDEIEEWANKRGIKIREDSALSWHCPNHTTLIEFRINDKELFRQAVKTIQDLAR